MKFYGRKRELERIEVCRERVRNAGAQIIVISGRRRIGKTRLAMESVKERKFLYFFVTRKKMDDLLRDWVEEIRRQLGNVVFGELQRIEDLLEFLYEYSRKEAITVIFDEFQNFYQSSDYVYSVFQKYYDLNRRESKMLLIFSGSSHSLMERIFKGSKEPLFGRAAEIIDLSYLSIQTQWEYAGDQGISSQRERLSVFSVFDGVPKYLEEMAFYSGKSFNERFEKILMEKDWIWDEGENILKEEFGKEYISYYSILSAIARGRRVMGEIQHYAGISDASPYLKKLEDSYHLIKRQVPVTVKNMARSRKGRYYLQDNFYAFWFRFIEPRRYLREIGQRELAIRTIIEQLPQYYGRKLEELVIRYIIEENPLNWEFTKIGGYWDRKGEIEIDVVILNEISKEAYFLEVKRDAKKLNKSGLENLKEQVAKIGELQEYKKMYGYAYPANGDLMIELEK